MDVTLFGKKVFACVIKLFKVLKIILDYWWALNPMTVLIKRQKRRHRGKRKTPCEDRGRD